MAWITIMVVAFIIAAACLLSKLIDYKAQVALTDNIKKYIDEEFAKLRKRIREDQISAYSKK